MIEFMGALYNEESNLEALIDHVYAYIDKFNFVDDGSTDRTLAILVDFFAHGAEYGIYLDYQTIEHTGLPETVKAKALAMCKPDSWVIMLDADERFAEGVLIQLYDFIQSNPIETHVWFTLEEAIDGIPTRTFQKCRAFRADSVSFSDTVHMDDGFTGSGAFFGWKVYHHKTSEKQIRRETEYLATYQRLLEEGKIDENRLNEMKSFHYFVR